METLSERLKRLRKEANLSQQRVADAVGVSRVAVTKWESGQTTDIRHDSLTGLAKLYKISLEALISGKEMSPKPLAPTRNLEEAGLPLISWEAACRRCESQETCDEIVEKYIPAAKSYGRHAYALVIKNDSMVSSHPGVQSYLPGQIIFVDPDRAPTSGCRVVAKVGQSNEVTFKVYSEDAGKRFLRPLNAQYPTIEMGRDSNVCGVVVGGCWDE